MQYAQQRPPPPQQFLNTGYPSRPYSAPAPPGFPHPSSSPYPSPYPTPGSSTAHTPQYLVQLPPATSTPNLFPEPHPPAGRPLPNSPSGPYLVGAPPIRPTLNTQFNSPSAGLKQHTQLGRRRASSTPPTPAAGASGVSGQIQCSGVTKAGKRCTRLVKGGPALVGVWGAASPISSNVERFCHQHAKELLGPNYIPPYLHPDTQVALRVEMEKPRSQSDVEGYIYTFEIRDSNDPSPPTISLKVGRAVNVVKRLNQWGKQCGSKEQVLRGWYPGEVDTDSEEANDTVGQSLMKGRVKAGGRGVWCHRLERLIHLELADLAVHAPYLQPGWEAFNKGSGRDRFLANGLGNGGGGAPCKDCGQIHKEIFELARVPKRPKGPKGPKGKNSKKRVDVDYYGMEWEDIVKKVIDEWGTFVENYV
ncbi:hypothetical protein J3R30DRAFT_3655895 [Lentinula aciculospora]|uniref:DUF1766-domain-containing protein n=1 Tax=Lentinula aciculospora TaxID=153920 RepID=A0A9W9AK95_9AGAR|nr:hypothetical protein J3R30DRAFT_3655895 [Lentinula aciculospora]